jgi:hypothetical protein
LQNWLRLALTKVLREWAPVIQFFSLLQPVVLLELYFIKYEVFGLPLQVLFLRESWIVRCTHSAFLVWAVKLCPSCMRLSKLHRHRHFDQASRSRLWLQTHVVSLYDALEILKKVIGLLTLLSLTIF